jgi:lipopolysaccharide exporter
VKNTIKELYFRIKSLMLSDSLLSRSLRSGGILASASVVENLLRFVRNVVLARLLAPDAFGLMATVMAAVAMLEAFSEVGLRQSIIQNNRGSEDDFLNIIWWLSVIRGMIIYCIAYMAAPFIGEFFNRPDSTMILRTGFLAIPFNALVSPRITVLEKKLQFMRWVVLMQGSAVAGIAIAIGSAVYFQNVWALILGYISESVFKCLLSYIYCPIFPVLKFNTVCLKDILSFSRGMYGLPIMMLLFVQTDVIIIGRVLSMELLGLYAIARGLSEIPANFFSKIAHPILLPSFSMLQDNHSKLNNAILDTTNMMATMAIPLFVFFILFSDLLLSLLYGAIYGSMAVTFSILCIYSFVYLCSSIAMSAFISIGMPSLQRTASATRTVLFLVIIYPAVLTLGPSGAAASLLITTIVSLAIQQYYLKNVMMIRVAEYFKTWMLGIKISIIVLIPGITLRIVIKQHDEFVFGSGMILCLIAWIIGIIKMVMLREKLRAAY